jgi:hypothetical protein
MKKTMFMLTIPVVGYQIVFAQQWPFESVRQLLAYDQVVSYQKICQSGLVRSSTRLSRRIL